MVAGQDMHNFSQRGRTRLEEGLMLPEDATDAIEGKQKALDLQPLLRTLQRNIFLIGGAVALCGGIQAYSAMTAPPVYEANFHILVEPVTAQARSVDPYAISRDGQGDQNTLDYSTLLQVLQSPEILAKIATDIQTQYPDVTAESLRNDLSSEKLTIERLQPENSPELTKVIQISYQDTDPQKVHFILDKISKGYLRYSLEDRKTRIGGGIQFIEDRLPELQQRVDSLEGQLQNLRQRYRLSDPESEGTELSRQLTQVRSLRQQAERELKEQFTLYSRLNQQLNLTPNEAMAAASLSENPRYQNLLTDLKKIEAEIAVKSARFSQQSPVVQALQEKRDNLSELLNQETQENLTGQPVAGATPNDKVLMYQNPLRLELIRQLVTAGNTAQVLQVRSQATAQEEAFLDRRLQQFPIIVREYNSLQQQLEIATKTLNQFLTQRETLRIEVAQKEIPWEVISPPPPATNIVPKADSIIKKLMIGIVGGLALGMLLALLKEKQRNVFYTGEDASSVLSLPLLATIPAKKGLTSTLNLLAADSSDPFSKAFNSLYTGIRFLPANPPLKSIVIGSAEAGDGKTTVALNLALAAATLGQKVLLVDANLRQPQIHKLLDLPNAKGFAECLLGKAKLEDAIEGSSLDSNLSVLVAGQALSHSARRLASNDIAELVNQLHNSFDLVIYDSPDLSEYEDAKFLAALADGLVLVAGVEKTDRSELKQVVDTLNRFYLPMLGVVANHPAPNRVTSYTPKPGAEQVQDQPALLENLGVLKRTT